MASYTHSPLSPDDILSSHFTLAAVSSFNGGSAINEAYVLAPTANSFFFLKDHLNSVTDIIDSAGQIVQKFNYSVFGSIKSIKIEIMLIAILLFFLKMCSRAKQRQVFQF